MREFAKASIGTRFDWPGLVKFGVRIVLGMSDVYHWRVSVDVLIVLFALGVMMPLLRFWAALAALSYVLVVLINTPARLRTKRETNRA
jgi:hypothetical protein